MEDPTPAPAGERAPPAGPDVMLWLGLLVIVCALIVLVLQRRRAAAPRISGEFPSETVQVDQTAREVAPEVTIAAGAEADALAFAAVELSTEGAIAGEVHSHKRLRRHPELVGSVIDADL